MRASTAVAILSLAAGVAPSVALTLPAVKSGGAGGGVNLNKPPVLSPHLPPPPLPRDLSTRLMHSAPSTPEWPSEPPSPPPPHLVPLPPSPTPPPPHLHHPRPVYAYPTSYLRLSEDGNEPFSRRMNQRIKLAARAYVQELLTTPMDVLD